MKVVISDTSVLCYLALIERLPLLEALFTQVHSGCEPLPNLFPHRDSDFIMKKHTEARLEEIILNQL